MAETFKHRAILAIKSKKSDSWRLSLATIDLGLNEKGSVK